MNTLPGSKEASDDRPLSSRWRANTLFKLNDVERCSPVIGFIILKIYRSMAGKHIKNCPHTLRFANFLPLQNLAISICRFNTCQERKKCLLILFCNNAIFFYRNRPIQRQRPSGRRRFANFCPVLCERARPHPEYLLLGLRAH
jgi:hypothetical protein